MAVGLEEAGQALDEVAGVLLVVLLELADRLRKLMDIAALATALAMDYSYSGRLTG